MIKYVKCCPMDILNLISKIYFFLQNTNGIKKNLHFKRLRKKNDTYCLLKVLLMSTLEILVESFKIIYYKS